MRRSGSVGAGICSWVFRRHFWQHQRENLFVLVILTLGFLFYVVYGAWTSSVSSSSAVQVEPLQLPADVMVRVPGWAEQVTVPDMDPARLFDPERLADAVRNHPLTEQIPPVYRPTPPPPRVRTIVKALAVRVMTPGGNVEVWGVDEWNQLLLEALPLQAGRWPENAQEVVVHAQFAEDTGVELGDDIPLTYVLPDAAVERQLAVRLVGVYTGDYDLVPSLMLPIAGVQQLTRARRANLIMAWAEPVPDLVVETGPPSNQTLSYPRPQLEDLLGEGLQATRVPTIGPLPAAKEYHPIAEQAQFLLPFGVTVDDRIYVNGSTATGVTELYRGIAIRMSPITALIFLSQGIGLTVVLALMVVDRQRLLGTYRVLGLSTRQLRWLYLLQVGIVGITATALGGLLFLLLRAPLETTLGMPPSIDRLTMVLWFLAVLVFALWSAYVAGSLYATTDIDSLLRANFDLDWWSIVRFGISPAGEIKSTGTTLQHE